MIIIYSHKRSYVSVVKLQILKLRKMKILMYIRDLRHYFVFKSDACPLGVNIYFCVAQNQFLDSIYAYETVVT